MILFECGIQLWLQSLLQLYDVRIICERFRQLWFESPFAQFLDGLDATKTIRQLTDIQQPHICALTANAMAEDQERCQLAGMDDFLAKPVRLQDLKRVLTEMSP